MNNQNNISPSNPATVNPQAFSSSLSNVVNSQTQTSASNLNTSSTVNTGINLNIPSTNSFIGSSPIQPPSKTHNGSYIVGIVAVICFGLICFMLYRLFLPSSKKS